MPTSLTDNRAARDAILGRVQQGARASPAIARAARADAEAYVAAHAARPAPGACPTICSRAS